MYSKIIHQAFSLLRLLASDRRGNFAVFAAVTLSVVTLGVGSSFDLHAASVKREKMQQALDAGMLAGVRKTNLATQRDEVRKVFLANFSDVSVDFSKDFMLATNADGSITGKILANMPTAFLGITGVRNIPISVKSSAIALADATPGPCIYVLGSSGQDVLINARADWDATKCTMDVASTANPAFVGNSGSTLNFALVCVKGTQYTNRSTIPVFKVGCATHADPFAGTLPEPTVSNTCTTSGTMDGSNITLQPGVHCGTTFNGSPTITFAPGLHIIKGRMIINSGAKVIANGVSFYFPDTNSEIRPNGTISLTATAPTTGIYKGLLMFEKTSDAANNANKTQYIINSTNGQALEGIIYLPNRNVTLNAKSTVTARLTMVMNQTIFDETDWTIEPYTATGASVSAAGARLTE
jgi:hypothetical protein